jgi:hypothetical protein
LGKLLFEKMLLVFASESVRGHPSQQSWLKSLMKIIVQFNMYSPGGVSERLDVPDVI